MILLLIFDTIGANKTRHQQIDEVVEFERSDDNNESLIYDRTQTIRFVVISMLIFLLLIVYIVVKVIGVQKIKSFISVNLLKRRPAVIE